MPLLPENPIPELLSKREEREQYISTAFKISLGVFLAYTAVLMTEEPDSNDPTQNRNVETISTDDPPQIEPDHEFTRYQRRINQTRINLENGIMSENTIQSLLPPGITVQDLTIDESHENGTIMQEVKYNSHAIISFLKDHIGTTITFLKDNTAFAVCNYDEFGNVTSCTFYDTEQNQAQTSQTE